MTDKQFNALMDRLWGVLISLWALMIELAFKS